jgi:hypothetical protein
MSAEPTRRVGAQAPAQPPAQPTAGPVAGSPSGTVELPEEFRSELDEIMRDLLTSAQELAFEYSTLDCSKILDCPLAQKSKELFKCIKRLNEVAKRLAPRPAQVTYTR